MERNTALKRIYGIIRSPVLHTGVTLTELAYRRGKPIAGRALIAATLAGMALFASLAYAEPTGGQVSAGSGSIAQAGASTTITQQSQNLAIDWNTFSIAAGESVRFNQPNASAIALNRILSANPSQINGSLSANGQVFILNPNGVLFGKGAQVNVGGLVASTLALSNDDFMAGNFTFNSPLPQAGEGSGVRVVNQGTLTAADGGYIALLAPEVRNEGVITATLGTALLAAGDRVTLNLDNGSLLGYSIAQGALNALADNKQLIQADGGLVILSAKAADALSTAVVNNTGIIEAHTIQNQGGVIKLLGDMQVGQVNVGGTLDTSAPDGGNGGFIDTSAAHVKVANDAKITTQAQQGISGNWLIDPTDYTIASSGGDITGAALSANLNTTSVTILSSSGASGTNGDIFVNDAVSWTSASSLTLNAIRHVNINAAISNTGSGKLVMRADMNAGSAGTISFGASGSVALSSGRADLYYNPSAYTSPTDYSSWITGTYTAWMLVNDVTQLQAMNTNLAGNYALGTNVDATVTSTWNAGAGFVPVGNNTSQFTGLFDGLGYTISNLVVNRTTTSYVGLFGYTATGSTVKNVGLQGGSMSGSNNAGGLVGYNSGTLSNVYATDSVNGASFVGGLAGYSSGSISNSYATGSVNGSSEIGGLAGYNSGTLTNVNATGSVNGSSNVVGGLAGFNSGGVSNSYATGNVSGGNYYVGGLVGTNYGTLDTNYASGSVSGSSYVGGLVGYNVAGTITKSYASGSVSGNNAGGLVGANSASISFSYASGSISGSTYIGGLAGINYSSISKSYATGSVNGSTYVGGLVGYNTSTINTTYATGSVSGGSSVGGLAGFNSATGSISLSYWDTVTSGQSSSAGGTGRTTIQMMTASNFAWNIANTGGTTKEWRIYDGYTYPLLANFLRPLTVAANDAVKTYDGLAFAGGNGVNYSDAGALSNVNIFDSAITYGGTSQGAVDAGGYTITAAGLYSNQQGYDIISYVNGILTVDPVALTITANDNFKVLNDTEPNLATSGVNYSGFVNGEDQTVLIGALSLTRVAGETSGVYDINASGLTATNYAITYVPGVFTISQINELMIMMGNGSAVYGDDPASLLFAPIYAKYNNGSGIVDLLPGAINTGGSAWTLNDGANTASFTAGTSYAPGNNVGNYSINTGAVTQTGFSSVATTAGTLAVTPATLTVTADNITKTYGQTLIFTGAEFTPTGLQNGDTIGSVSLASTGAAATADVAGGPYTITANTATGGTFIASNYNISFVDGALAVDPATLTVTANAASKTYDGFAYGGGNGVAYSGFVNGETSAVVGGTLAYVGTSQGAVDAGSYLITPDGLTSGNYTFNYVDGALTVTPATLTVTANNNGKVINDTEPDLYVTGASYSGFVNGETPAVLVGALALARDPGEAAGTYSINASGHTSGNYTINYTPGTFTISPAGQLLIVMADGSAVYGVDPSGINFTPIYASYTNGITVTDLLAGATNTGNNWTLNDGLTTFTAGTNYLLGGNVGNYIIDTGAISTSNVNFSTTSTTIGTLTVTPLPVTLDAPVTPTKVYDGTNALAMTSSTVGISNRVGSDDVSIAGIGSYADQNAGTGKGYTLDYLSLTGAAAGNYSLGVSTLSGIDGVIDPATLTVTANDITKTYGQTLTFAGTEFTPTGLQNGETIGGVTLDSIGKDAPANVAGSPYAITATGATGGTFNAANYTINYVDGALTVDPATLTVTANAASKTYDGLPYLGNNGVVYTGFVNGETSALLGGTLVYSGASQGAVNAGSYLITPSGLTAPGNYTISFVDGALTITPAALTVTANNATKAYGQTLTFTGTEFTFAGLQGIETIGSVSLASSGEAATAGVAGSPYAITASGATGGTFDPANYTISYVDGALVVTPVALTVTANDIIKTYGQTLNFAGTEFSATGLQNGETIGSVSLASAGAAATADAAGSPYAITASAATGGSFDPANYTISYVDGALTINPAFSSNTLVLAYNAAQNGIANAGIHATSNPSKINGELISIVNCGVLMPSDAPANTCNN